MKGWGAKKVPAVAAAAPKLQPARVEVVLEVEPDPRPQPSVKAQTEWHQLRAKRGWPPETINNLFYEFIQSRELFAELVNFARKRR